MSQRYAHMIWTLTVVADTYKLLKDALVECLFWLPAPVELLVVLLETLEVGFPLLTTAVAQLLDAVVVDVACSAQMSIPASVTIAGRSVNCQMSVLDK